jgi:endonuclease/exonuclease/phosphatase (EEP) superfamily protein YafD
VVSRAPRRALWLALGGLAAATLLSFLGRWFWFPDLLSHFRLHMAVGGLLALIVAAALRAGRPALVAALVLAANLWPVAGYLWPVEGTQLLAPRAIRVANMNVLFSNQDMAQIAAWVERSGADVAVFEELEPASELLLAAGLPSYSHRFSDANLGHRGAVVFSRLPLRAASVVMLPDDVPAARVVVDLGDRALTVYGVHLNWPLSRGSWRARNAQLEALASEVATCTGACSVFGDFNTTPWSSFLTRFRERAGLRDCARGRALALTWPSWPFAQLRIDHCFGNAAVDVRAVRVEDSLGSDHLPTLSDLDVGR